MTFTSNNNVKFASEIRDYVAANFSNEAAKEAAKNIPPMHKVEIVAETLSSKGLNLPKDLAYNAEMFKAGVAPISNKMPDKNPGKGL